MKELKGRVGESLAQRVQSGQAGPTEITRATQILIDRGKLPAEPAGDLGARIKTMQWQYGIGIDCACFTRHAAASAIGRTSIPVGNDLGMRQLDSNAHFSKVKPGQVRPGDIMTLGAKPPETIGHNVIVRNNDRLSDLEGREKAVANPELTSFFVGKGPFHSISVDSSWGAGCAYRLRHVPRRVPGQVMRHVAALLALVIWFLAASPAQAQARGWRSATLPFGEIDRAAMAIVSGAEPSEMHRLGTALVLACEHEQLIAEEWELAGPPRLLREKVLATLTRSSGAVVAERAGSDVYVLTAALDDADDDQVVLFTLDASLTVRAREVIGHGVVPSMAVDERRVLTAFHERRAPMASLSRRAPPARFALHVAVRDRAAMQVVSGAHLCR